MSDVLTTILHKAGEELHIRFAPGRGVAVKEIRANGKVLSRNMHRNADRNLYRSQVRSSVKWGWTVGSSSEPDLMPGAQQAPRPAPEPDDSVDRDHLDLAVRWERGWKTYEVTGTRHAYYMLRKIACQDGFNGARLDVSTPGTPNVTALSVDDITGDDTDGTYAALLDRSNPHYDLEK